MIFPYESRFLPSLGNPTDRLPVKNSAGKLPAIPLQSRAGSSLIITRTQPGRARKHTTREAPRWTATVALTAPVWGFPNSQSELCVQCTDAVIEQELPYLGYLAAKSEKTEHRNLKSYLKHNTFFEYRSCPFIIYYFAVFVHAFIHCETFLQLFVNYYHIMAIACI